jgi:signal transduction histidine kinase
MRANKEGTYPKTIFSIFSLRTQLLLILLFLLALSVGSLTIIYERSEDVIMDKITDNIQDVTKAIQISVEELTYRGDSAQRLKSYVDMLNKKGIKEITVIGDDSQVIASSDPRKIGTKQRIFSNKESTVAKKKEKAAKKKDLFITATLGEKSARETQRLYNVIMPVSIKGKDIGYILMSLVLDDYRFLQQKNHLKRVLSMIFAFTIGMLICVIIAEKYTEPIKRISRASRRIAQGELVKIRDSKRRDEIGVLVRSFNEMVEELQGRRELEEKLRKSEQLSMVGQLAAGVAHEVRNPLNFFSLSIGHLKALIAEEKMKDHEEILALLDNLTREIYRVNELINNFLFLGKPVLLNREWLTPGALVDDALYLLKDKVPEGIHIKVLDRTEGKLLWADRVYMRICLINLLLNSVQAIDGTGEVSLEFGTSKETFCISVHDNGKGIEKEDLDKIFEPYYSTKKLGVGLGLSITKRLVEEHGGRIFIESKAGEGTTTIIEVPIREG